MAENEVRHGTRIAKEFSPEDHLAAYRRRENYVSPWKFLRENRIDEGLELFRKGDSMAPPCGTGLGQALMWVRQYELAVDHFERSIGIPKKLPTRNETLYSFLGAARWCLGDFSAAFRDWQGGVNAPYATGGICTETPLLLVAGSILRPEHQDRGKVEEILRKKLSGPRAGQRTEHWPGCLGKFVLGKIPKEAMSAWWVRTTGLYEAFF